MAIEFDVDAEGLDEARELLKDAQKRLEDLTPALKVTAEKIKGEIDKSFQQSKSADGTAWPRLAASTVRQKLRKRYSAKPLIRRGARGLQGATHATAKDDKILVGVSPTAPHGKYHQQGTRSIPRRAFLPFTKSGQLMGGPRMKAIVEDMTKRIRRYVFGE